MSNANLPNGMEIVSLPLSNDVPWYFFQITLSGVIYTLTFKYNTRMSRWIMGVGDAMNKPILEGMLLVINRNVTKQFIGQTGVPIGTFFVRQLNAGDQKQPTRYSFGTTHTCFYLDPLALT